MPTLAHLFSERGRGNMACVGQTVPQRTHSGRQAPLLGSWTGEKSPPMPACNQADCSAWLGQACMQRPQRRQHARTSGSGSEPGARTGMVEGHAKSTPCTRPRQVPAARDRQKVLREGRGELPALLLRSPACGAYRSAPYSQACIQERQVRHSQAMARLPDMPGASRPAGQAKAHCPHPVHVRSLTILNGTRRAKSARSAPAGHRYLHQKRGRTHSRTARTSQKTSTKEAVLKEPCSICR